MDNYMMTTRRIFLHRSLAMLAAGVTVPTFLDQTVLAMDDPLDSPLTQPASGKDGKILVVVQLSGGNDGLSTVVPFGDDAYYRARPNLSHAPKDILKLTDYLGLHPNLAPLQDLYGDGCMTIIQGVGYPNPNRSHFRAMDIWHSADSEREDSTVGWVGRYFDNTCKGCDPHVGVSIGDTLPLAMQGAQVTPLAFERPEMYRYNGRDRETYLKLNRLTTGLNEDAGRTIEDIKAPRQPAPPSNIKHRSSLQKSQLDFLTRTAMDAQASSDQILRITRDFSPVAEYPGGEFGNGMRTVAAMIGGGLSTRVYYVTLGGFDTHAGQRGRHDALMQQFAQGVSAFWKDIKHQGNDDRVLVMGFSEFGRRVSQNASNGTDHGAAAPMFLFGPNLKGPIAGQHPSLTDLDGGDLKYSIDFRHVYSAVLQKWLDTPSRPILGRAFRPLPVFKA